MTTTRNNVPKLTRREFVQASAGIAATLPYGRAWGGGYGPNRSVEHGNALGEFDYGQIQFEPGPHQLQLEQTIGILMELDENSLLRPFRLRGGFPAPGFELGGWYSSNGRDPGHAFGQWISALARYYAITGEQKIREKVVRLVDDFAKTVEPAGKLYENYANRSYLYEKLCGGLVDAHRFARHPEGLQVLNQATSAALPHLPGRPCVPQPTDSLQCMEESYTIPENQLIAWQCGGDTRHLQIARQYLHDELFDPLARGENIFGGRHGYSNVNALCSAVKAYLVFGDRKYLEAARNGFAFLEQQSYATGAWAADERFLPRPRIHYPEYGIDIPPIDRLGPTLIYGRYHFETPCGSYAHFKLARYLLRITQDARYGDSMERIMYNTVPGALPLNKFGKAFYHSNYHSHARKEYFDGYQHSMEDEWPCCSGTLPQVAADYRINTYFRDSAGVFVNLYIPSTLRWVQGGVQLSLTQSGQYPLDDGVALEVMASRPVRFAIRLRIPEWARAPAIWINGKKISQPVRGGSFAALRREWKSGDRIELELPRQLKLQPVDLQSPDTVALMCGPLVLFAVADDTPKPTRAQLLAAHQQSRGSREWRVDTAAGPLRLMPFWAIRDETYFTYLSV